MTENKNKGRLVVISGPSCAGKSPLLKSLQRFHPEALEGLEPVVLYNSRQPRPGEEDGIDYHFRKRDEVKALSDKQGFEVLDVRGDTQAVDFNEMSDQLADSGLIYEGNPFVGECLLQNESLSDFQRLSIFISPLSRDEIEYLQSQEAVDMQKLVSDVMRRKLLRRTRKQKGELSKPDLDEIERRCTSAWSEIQKASQFEHFIANHDGEDSENWDAFYYPLGDARKTVEAVASILSGDKHKAAND